MNNKTTAFFARHNFNTNVDVNAVTEAILYDMNEGLTGNPSGQDMIRTFSNPPSEKPVNKSVIVIDAGGTNFRSCLVNFNADGIPSISDMQKTRMPATDRELSKKEFFEQLAENISHLKDKASHIGFCFSYPMIITEDGDGKLIKFTKEVKAPEVEGCLLGKELLSVLKEKGWTTVNSVKLLNDTVAALMAGAAATAPGKEYSSYIGFILGTGMNAAYIQDKNESYKDLIKQIIVCECGKFNQLSLSDFDRTLDNESVSKGTGLLEKMSSGAYLGPLSLIALKEAAKDQLFTPATCEKILSVKELNLIEANSFLNSPLDTKTQIGSLLKDSALEDKETCFEIINAIVERSAKMAASTIAACVIKSEEGKSPLKPVCVLCNGTTFFKTWRIYSRTQAYLEEVLTRQRGLNFELCQAEDDITLGTAIGALS